MPHMMRNTWQCPVHCAQQEVWCCVQARSFFRLDATRSARVWELLCFCSWLKGTNPEEAEDKRRTARQAAAAAAAGKKEAAHAAAAGSAALTAAAGRDDDAPQQLQHGLVSMAYEDGAAVSEVQPDDESEGVTAGNSPARADEAAMDNMGEEEAKC
jgi:hypothetical protein